MLHLNLSYWQRFLRPNGNFDGRLFEKLVERLLNLHFKGIWHITKISWDGGKDAVSEEFRTTPEGKRIVSRSWAECKLHRKPVALRLVSNTLVMAVIDEAKRLLLFSYSPIVDNARLHLARFSHATGITVEIVDDEILEQLILRYIDELRTIFFPNLPLNFEAHTDLGGLQITARLSRDVESDPLRLNEDNAVGIRQDGTSPILNLRSLLRVQLAVRNRRLTQSSQIRVSVEDADPMKDTFELVNAENRTSVRTLQPLGLSIFEFYLRPGRSGQELPLPIFSVVDGNQSLPPVDLGCVNVRSLLLPPLLGGRFHEFIAAFRDHISLRAKPVIAAVSGSAGVGKSRLATELIAAALSTGAEVHRFDGDGKCGSYSTFARAFLAQLYRLPDFPIKIVSKARGPKQRARRVGLERLLYDDGINPANHVEEVLALVKRGIGTRRVALIVDNVQYLDFTTIKFLLTLVRDYYDTAARFLAVFVFNTDFLELNENATIFLEFLHRLRRADDEHIAHFELSDLSSGEVNLFLDHLISIEASKFERGFTQRHPLLAELLHKKIIPRPLDVLQTMFYLADEQALFRRGDYLYVENIDRLHDSLERIPPELKSILDRRWQRILEARPNLEVAGRLLSLLRTIRDADMTALGIPLDERELLISLGLAKENELGEFAFFHERVETYFAERYARLEAPLAIEVARTLERVGLADTYFAPYVITCAQAGIEDDALVARANRYLCDDVPCNGINVALGNCLRKLLRKHPRALSAADELRAVRRLTMLVSAPYGLSYRLKVFDEEVGERKRQLSRYKAEGSEFLALLKDQASCHFGTQSDSCALDLLLAAKSLLPQFEFSSPTERNLSEASILNRLCVAYKSLADASAALSAGQASLKEAQRLGAHELIFLNHVDLGYIYYGSVPPSSELFEHWGNAVSHFDRHEEEIMRKSSVYASCANLIRSHLMILEGRLDEAREVNDLWTARCMRQFDAFYAVGFMLLQVTRHLLAPPAHRSVNLLRGIIDRAIDTCETYKVNRAYWKALHARGKVEFLAGARGRAMDAYGAALRQLLNVTVEANEILFRYFFEDMAITARQLSAPLPKDTSRIRNPCLREQVREIASLSDDGLTSFLENYRPCSTFNNGTSNLPCP